MADDSDPGAWNQSLFRPEAVRHHASLDEPGELLNLSPSWSAWTFRAIVALIAVGGAYSAIGRIYHYALGPAVVHTGVRTFIRTTTAGIVSTLYVQAGQNVQRGQPLARITPYRTLERSRPLQSPAKRGDDPGPSSKTFVLFAPRGGRISHIRVPEGQDADVDDTIMTLTDPSEAASVDVIIPNRYRPLLHPGIEARLELDGFSYQYLKVTIDSISNDVLEAQEAQRALDAPSENTALVKPYQTLVRARLDSTTFRSGGQVYDVYEGLHGRVSIRLDSEPLIVSLLPPLRRFF